MAATIPAQLNPTQVKIIFAYLDLCHKHGVTEITFQKVADKAKVAFNTVHYHFGGHTEGLARHALSYLTLHGQSFVRSALDRALQDEKRDPIESYVYANFEWARKFPSHTSYWVYQYYLSSTLTYYRQEHAEALAVAHLRVKSLIIHGIGIGLYKPCSNLDELSRQVHAQVLGGFITALADSSLSLDEYEKRVSTWARAVVPHVEGQAEPASKKTQKGNRRSQ
jgi:hypothetical protein